LALLVHDGTIITPDCHGVQVLRHFSLVVRDGRIVESGPASAFAGRIAAGEFDEVIAADHHLVIPGLINAHHHLFQSLTRCLPSVQNRRLFDWLRGLYGPWRRLSYQAVQIAAQVSLAELALHGCTTTSDHFYMFPPGSDVRIEAVIEAARQIGLRLHLCRGSMTLGRKAGGLPPDECVERDEDVLSDCLRVLDAWHDPSPCAFLRIDLAPCSPFNASLELLRATRDLARQRRVLLHTHLAESLDEERYCLERYGCRPVQLLADLGWLGPDVYLAHAVWLNGAEIALLARTQTAVVHCPASNMRLASGLAPLQAFLAAGVRVGLGVDGSSSNDCGNLLAEARLAVLSARLRQVLAPCGCWEDRVDAPSDELFPAYQAFRLATVGGASCLNRPELGHLNPGAAADFAMFRRDDVALAAAVEHDPVAALVLCNPPRADRVFVGGRQIVREGRLLTSDEMALSQRLNELARRFG
jgi:8-oxoguanine deaminase